MRLNRKQLRLLINEEVEKIENSRQINEFAGKEAFKIGIKNILKSAGLAIPGLDIWLGTFIAGVDLINIKIATDNIIDELPIIGSSIIEKLAAPGDEWNEVLVQVQTLPEEKREELKDLYNELLGSIKDFILTLIQSYDSLAAAPVAVGAGAASAGTGAIAVEAGTNLTTGIGSLIAGVMPIERFLFSMGTKIAKATEWILSFIKEENPDKVIDMTTSGGEMLTYFIDAPSKTFIRLGELYNALHNPEENIIPSAKDIDKEDIATMLTDLDTLTESRFIKLAGIK